MRNFSPPCYPISSPLLCPCALAVIVRPGVLGRLLYGGFLFDCCDYCRRLFGMAMNRKTDAAHLQPSRGTVRPRNSLRRVSYRHKIGGKRFHNNALRKSKGKDTEPPSGRKGKQQPRERGRGYLFEEKREKGFSSLVLLITLHPCSCSSNSRRGGDSKI